MKLISKALVFLIGCLIITLSQAYSGKVVDAKTKAPIEGVIVTLGDQVTKTAADGSFQLNAQGETLKLRTAGYARQEIPTANLKTPRANIELTPFIVKGLYLSPYGFADKKIRTAALQTLKDNHMNALIIDFKGDRGFIPFKVNIPLAQQIGAQDIILVKDMPTVIADMKKQGLYLIARIVTFKDDKLAAAKPDWAVKKGNGVFYDREKLRWVDPFNHQVWDYNIAIAKAAADMGFDEVQFDYVRCPDTTGVTFSQPSTAENRVKTISGFLQAAHTALAPSNVMVAADIFGYTTWNKGDTGIGQQIEEIVKAVDVVSLMLYPSGFHLGIPNYRNPVEHPYEIVYLTLKHVQERTKTSPLHFRPWLQAFRDYAFQRQQFNEDKMWQQIKAANNFGASGYMFWNPRNVYPKGQFARENQKETQSAKDQA